MKMIENWFDFIAIAIGVVGALLKGLKKKYNLSTIGIGMLIAGVLTYSVTGVIEMFYSGLSTKVVILISFCVGWIANEITEKLDEFVNDIYSILIAFIRSKFSSTKKQNENEKEK
jgi:hypothetical protein